MYDLTCSLCLGCVAKPLSTELAKADTFPRGSFSDLATAWRPSLFRLHSAQCRKAWTITSWSEDARFCTNHTVERTISVSFQGFIHSECSFSVEVIPSSASSQMCVSISLMSLASKYVHRWKTVTGISLLPRSGNLRSSIRSTRHENTG